MTKAKLREIERIAFNIDYPVAQRLRQEKEVSRLSATAIVNIALEQYFERQAKLREQIKQLVS